MFMLYVLLIIALKNTKLRKVNQGFVVDIKNYAS